jgi:hypothetical protein
LPAVASLVRLDAYAVVEVSNAVSEPALVEEIELRADVLWQGAPSLTGPR